MRLKYKRLAGYRTGEMHETARPGYEKTGLFEDGGGVCNRHTSSVDYVTQSGIFFAPIWTNVKRFLNWSMSPCMTKALTAL